MNVLNVTVSVEVNISIYCYSADIRIYLWLNNEIDSKIDVIAMQYLLVQNWQQTNDWTLIGSGANGLGIQECHVTLYFPGTWSFFFPQLSNKPWQVNV